MPEALLLPFLADPRLPPRKVPTVVVHVGGDPDGLRPYQREDLESIFGEFDDPFIRATLLVEATSLGKTRIGASVAKRWIREGRGRVLWAVTGEELCDQARDTLAAVTGEYVSLERAGYRADGTNIVVGSVPTMKGKRLKDWAPDTFGLIIFDEAHHAVANGPRAIFDHFINASILGMTATPERLDKKANGIVFDSVVPVDGHRHGRQIPWGWANGYLVKPRGIERILDSVDLSKMRSVGGDFVRADLDKEMLKSAAVIGHETFHHCGDRRTLVFCPGVWTVQAVCNDLNTRSPGCARFVTGETDPDERKRIVRGFAKDEFQYLVNYMVFGEGFDDPGIRAIVNAAPTRSKSRYIQRVGRGGRPLKGTVELPTIEERLTAIAASAKPDFLILDITGRGGEHSVVSFVTLDGNYSEAEQKKAKEIIAEQPELPVPDALRQARAAAMHAADERRKQEEAHRLVQEEAARAAVIRTHGREYDPFVAYGIKDPEAGSLDLALKPMPPTPKQLHWARSCGIPTEGISRQQMTKLFKANLMRTKHGLADFRTLGILRKHDIKVGNISMQKARALLRSIENHRGFRPPEFEVRAILGVPR